MFVKCNNIEIFREFGFCRSASEVLKKVFFLCTCDASRNIYGTVVLGTFARFAWLLWAKERMNVLGCTLLGCTVF